MSKAIVELRVVEPLLRRQIDERKQQLHRMVLIGSHTQALEDSLAGLYKRLGPYRMRREQ